MTAAVWLGMYGACGVVCALVALRRGARLDALFLFFFWPLYAPIAFAPAKARAPEAVAGARFVPDAEVAAALAHHVVEAKRRLASLEESLQTPELDLDAAELRRARYEAEGDLRMAALASARVSSIRRVVALRERFARELCEAEELLSQVKIHETLGRAGGGDAGSRAHLDELHVRVVTLAELLEVAGGE